MLEILYRIYRVLTDEERANKLNEENSYSTFNSYSNVNNEEICMDCFLCETREDFKEHIRAIYGKDTKFTNSKKYPPNTIYCIIIGEHCYNSEKYFVRYEFECDNCHTKCVGYINKPFLIDNYTISFDLLNQVDKYKDKKFCCSKCLDRFLAIERRKIANESDGKNIWVNRGDFKGEKIAGYIYKITKKSTGEFYIGQTIYEPMFRWAQHLGTERFKIDNILDYQYETIEIVPYGENILEREKYWIQKLYKENPSLSLNIMQTANLISNKNNIGE